MEKKYLYFQPQYVGEFICDSSKCNDNCCERGWNIDVDETTYKKYLKLDSEIAAQFEFNAAKKKYLLKKHPCPFLTEKKLCRLQRDYGEEFLSLTCKNYPRVTTYFGKFFERSLTLTCPVAARRILFQNKPMEFELVEVSEKIHGGERVLINPVHLDEKFLTHILEIQVAMISILQERTLTIDRRLIVLGFFLDRLDEIFSAKVFDDAALIKLISAYESKKILAEQVPFMLRSITLDTKKFSVIMFDLCKDFFGETKFTNNISKTAANYKRLGSFRKKFLAEHATFLENFLVNELFLNVYPWRFEGDIVKNFGVFAIKYKIFELTLISTALKNPVGKEELLSLADWFCSQFDHVEVYQRKIFSYLQGKEDAFNLLESLFEGSD
mgnify:CR=1 FL=1